MLDAEMVAKLYDLAGVVLIEELDNQTADVHGLVVVIQQAEYRVKIEVHRVH